MPVLQLNFPRGLTHPSEVTYTTSDSDTCHTSVIPEGETSDTYAIQAAESICSILNENLGPLEEQWVPADSYELSHFDSVLQLYLSRAGAHAGPAQRVIARWAAYNHLQLEADVEGWSTESITSLLATPRCQSIVAALTTFGWGVAVALLQGASTADHPLATPETIQAYLEAMAAEGALPE